MEVFVRKPDVQLHPGMRVAKDTVLEVKAENLEQKLENLVLHTRMKVAGEGYESTYDTAVFLKEGDILLYMGEDRGWIKPAEEVMTVAQAISELECIRDVGAEA